MHSASRRLDRAAVALLAGFVALGSGTGSAQPTTEPIAAPSGEGIAAAFDIVRTTVEIGERWLEFEMTVAGNAGTLRPEPVGQLAGAPVEAYVWPVDLDPAVVGFPADAGRLAFVVASHPDFDDTPLFDENDDGDWENDGLVWHVHWVVLTEEERCSAGLAVRDLGETDPADLPLTWPDMPIFIASPGYSPRIAGDTIEVRVPFRTPGAHAGVAFDGVTASLRVDPDLEEPLLCVTAVHDIASGDLSLPGRVGR